MVGYYLLTGTGDRFRVAPRDSLQHGQPDRASSLEIELQAFDRGILPSYPLARLTAQ